MAERQNWRMSKEAVLKIKEAEQRAQSIIENAQAESRKAIIDAEQRAQRDCDEFERSVKAEYRASVDEVRREVQEIIDKSLAECDRKCGEKENAASEHMSEAIKVIISGVMSECQ